MTPCLQFTSNSTFATNTLLMDDFSNKVLEFVTKLFKSSSVTISSSYVSVCITFCILELSAINCS